MSRISLGKLNEFNSGYFKKIIVDDIESLERFLAHNVPEVSSSVGVAFVIIVLLFAVDWRLALCSVITVPLSFKVLAQMMNGTEEKMGKYAESLEHLNSSLVEYIQGMEVIKAYHKLGETTKSLSSAIENFRYYVVDWYSGCWKYLTGFAVLAKANLLILIPVSGFLYINELVDLEIIFLFLITSFTFTIPMTKLVEFADTMPMINESFSQINQFLDLEELEYCNNKVNFKNYDLEFKNVSFSYEENKNAVNNLCFVAKQGKHTALVGSSGSGKTTTAKLAARFWDINSGEILIGGVPITKIPAKQLMETISFVFQKSYLFSMSIRDNLLMGKSTATDEEIFEAARKARCYELIKSKGLDTIVGGKNGIRLSGGEAQRLAIARAILKDSPILILDEATASLDNENQCEIQAAISELAKNKTVIAIAHRLSSITEADQILVFSNGEIKERGTNSELLNSDSLYSKLWNNYCFGSDFSFQNREEA